MSECEVFITWKHTHPSVHIHKKKFSVFNVTFNRNIHLQFFPWFSKAMDASPRVSDTTANAWEINFTTIIEISYRVPVLEGNLGHQPLTLDQSLLPHLVGTALLKYTCQLLTIVKVSDIELFLYLLKKDCFAFYSRIVCVITFYILYS